MMTIDSTPANLAATKPNVAPTDAKSAADGAGICTDAEGGDVAGFQAIFEQLSQSTAGEELPSPLQRRFLSS
jgi:hypothetical protein